MKFLNCIIGTFLIVLDQVTKYWAERSLIYSTDITSFFSLELAHNTGISFGFLSHQGPVIFWAVTACTACILMVFMQAMIKESRQGNFVGGYVCIVAGGFSNFLDRVCYGYVTDFIHFHYEDYSFPYFNFADVFIVFGVIIVMGQLFFED